MLFETLTNVPTFTRSRPLFRLYSCLCQPSLVSLLSALMDVGSVHETRLPGVEEAVVVLHSQYLVGVEKLRTSYLNRLSALNGIIANKSLEIKKLSEALLLRELELQRLRSGIVECHIKNRLRMSKLFELFVDLVDALDLKIKRIHFDEHKIEKNTACISSVGASKTRNENRESDTIVECEKECIRLLLDELRRTAHEIMCKYVLKNKITVNDHMGDIKHGVCILNPRDNLRESLNCKQSLNQDLHAKKTSCIMNSHTPINNGKTAFNTTTWQKKILNLQLCIDKLLVRVARAEKLAMFSTFRPSIQNINHSNHFLSKDLMLFKAKVLLTETANLHPLSHLIDFLCKI